MKNLFIVTLAVLCICLIGVAYNRGYEDGRAEGESQTLQALSLAKQYEDLALRCVDYKYKRLIQIEE